MPETQTKAQAVATQFKGLFDNFVKASDKAIENSYEDKTKNITAQREIYKEDRKRLEDQRKIEKQEEGFKVKQNLEKLENQENYAKSKKQIFAQVSNGDLSIAEANAQLKEVAFKYKQPILRNKKGQIDFLSTDANFQQQYSVPERGLKEVTENINSLYKIDLSSDDINVSPQIRKALDNPQFKARFEELLKTQFKGLSEAQIKQYLTSEAFNQLSGNEYNAFASQTGDNIYNPRRFLGAVLDDKQTKYQDDALLVEAKYGDHWVNSTKDFLGWVISGFSDDSKIHNQALSHKDAESYLQGGLQDFYQILNENHAELLKDPLMQDVLKEFSDSYANNKSDTYNDNPLIRVGVNNIVKDINNPNTKFDSSTIETIQKGAKLLQENFNSRDEDQWRGALNDFFTGINSLAQTNQSKGLLYLSKLYEANKGNLTESSLYSLYYTVNTIMNKSQKVLNETKAKNFGDVARTNYLGQYKNLINDYYSE